MTWIMSAFKKFKGLVTLESFNTFSLKTARIMLFLNIFHFRFWNKYWTVLNWYICWLKPRKRVPLSYISLSMSCGLKCSTPRGPARSLSETTSFNADVSTILPESQILTLIEKYPTAQWRSKLGNPAVGSKAAQHLHVWSSFQLPTWCQSNQNTSKYWGKQSTSSTARSQQEKFQWFQEHNPLLKGKNQKGSNPQHGST